MTWGKSGNPSAYIDVYDADLKAAEQTMYEITMYEITIILLFTKQQYRLISRIITLASIVYKNMSEYICN